MSATSDRPGEGALPAAQSRPPGPAGVFIDLAGVLLDGMPSHGQLPGLRGGVGAALRLLDRLDYRIIALAPCSLDRRQASRLLPGRLADLLARERVALAGCCFCGGASTPCLACPPAPAMLLSAAREHGLALGASWLLARDHYHLAAGQRAGCRTLAISADDSHENVPLSPASTPQWACIDGPAAYTVRDIVDAALTIIRLDGESTL